MKFNVILTTIDNTRINGTYDMSNNNIAYTKDDNHHVYNIDKCPTFINKIEMIQMEKIENEY